MKPSAADFTAAESQFRKILAIDPYRVDDIDILSNILYVTENNTALSRRAHDYLAIDKDRPEICCIIGRICRTSHRGYRLTLIAGPLCARKLLLSTS